VADDFVADIREAVEKARSGEQAPSGKTAVYGGLDKMDDRGPIRDIVFGTLEKMTVLEGEPRR
jgi:hypothetical protein